MTRQVLLAGEGQNELGGWFSHPSYRTKPEAGVLEALLRRIAPNGWEVRDAVHWKHLVRYRVGQGMPKDELNTRALWLLAKERRCDVIVFSRDRDGVVARTEHVKRGREWLNIKAQETGLTVVGAVAVESIEAWILACMEQLHTEELSRAQAHDALARAGAGRTKDFVDCIERADLVRVPADAESLRGWLAQASVLAAP